MNFYTIRKSARDSLKGNWGQAVLCYFIFFLIDSLLTLPSTHKYRFGGVLLNFLFFIILGPLIAGVNYFFLKLSRKEKTSLEDLFYPFKSFLRYFLCHLLTTIFSLLWSIPAIIVVVLTITGALFHPSIAEVNYHGSKYIFTPAVLLIIITFIIICIILGIFLNRYALAHFMLLDNPLLGSYDAIEESVNMMKGYKIKLFLLHLSFIGWWILSIFTLGIGLLWLLPYVRTSTAIFYEDVKKNYTY